MKIVLFKGGNNKIKIIEEEMLDIMEECVINHDHDIDQEKLIVKRKWTHEPYELQYFEYEGNVYRLDNDFCIFDVKVEEDYKLNKYYGCYIVHNRFDDEYVGSIEFNHVDENSTGLLNNESMSVSVSTSTIGKLPKSVECYFRNIIFDHLVWL